MKREGNQSTGMLFFSEYVKRVGSAFDSNFISHLASCLQSPPTTAIFGITSKSLVMPANRRSKSTVSIASDNKKKAGPAGRLSKKVQDRTCTICGKEVGRPADMSRHLDIHDPTKRIPCPYASKGCEFRTHQKSNLKSHIRVHKDEKTCICTICDFKSCHSSSLSRHQRRKHNIIPSTSPGPLPSESSSRIPSPNLFPFGETSTSLPFMPPSESLPSPPPWDGWFASANPTHSQHWHDYQQVQHRDDNFNYYPAQFPGHWQNSQYSQLTENLTPFTGTFGFLPAPITTLPTHSSLPLDYDLSFPSFVYSGDQSQMQVYQHDLIW